MNIRLAQLAPLVDLPDESNFLTMPLPSSPPSSPLSVRSPGDNELVSSCDSSPAGIDIDSKMAIKDIPRVISIPTTRSCVKSRGCDSIIPVVCRLVQMCTNAKDESALQAWLAKHEQMCLLTPKPVGRQHLTFQDSESLRHTPATSRSWKKHVTLAVLPPPKTKKISRKSAMIRRKTRAPKLALRTRPAATADITVPSGFHRIGPGTWRIGHRSGVETIECISSPAKVSKIAANFVNVADII